MRYLVFVVLIFSVGCGVNPERANELKARADKSSKKTSKKMPELTASDTDPEDVKKAIAGLDRMQGIIDTKDWNAYRIARYDVAQIVIFAADESVATHAKTPQIIQKLELLDAAAAEAMGSDGAPLADPSRENAASADAVFAMNEGVQSCLAKAPNVMNSAELNTAKTAFEAAVQKASGFDGRVERFSGRSPTGSGFIDVPTDVAVCRVMLASAESRLGDQPPVAQDLSNTYVGCGYFDVNVEATQLSSGGFDKYVVTSFFATEADPGAAEPIGCEKVPPVSDAPNDVQSVLKESVQWMQGTDIISMNGAFAYEQRTPTEMIKKGVARIYRRQSQLKTNRCGAKDKNVTCAADGDPVATMFDHGKHYMNRAEAYRAKGDAEKCKQMAQNILATTKAVPASGDATKIFQVAQNRRLTFTDIKAEIVAMNTQASEIVASDWCSKGQ